MYIDPVLEIEVDRPTDFFLLLPLSRHNLDRLHLYCTVGQHNERYRARIDFISIDVYNVSFTFLFLSLFRDDLSKKG